MTTFRQLKERPAAIYWRRRIVTLVIGLSVLALVAWASAGKLGGSARSAGQAAAQTAGSTQPASSPAPGALHRAVVPVGSPGPPRRAAGIPSASPTSHTTTTRRNTSRRTASRRTTTRSTTTRGATRSRPGLRACPVHEVVLSLFSSQASYTIRQTPAFEVDVVSTASQTCTFDIGARHVLLKISAGSAPIWTSADCAEGQASLVTKLYRGIPTVVPIAWNGQRSSPGCPVPGSPAPARSYSALATDGPLASNPLTFRIG